MPGKWTKVHYFSSASTIDGSRKIVLTVAISFAYHHRRPVSSSSFSSATAIAQEEVEVVRYLSLTTLHCTC